MTDLLKTITLKDNTKYIEVDLPYIEVEEEVVIPDWEKQPWKIIKLYGIGDNRVYLKAIKPYSDRRFKEIECRFTADPEDLKTLKVGGAIEFIEPEITGDE